MQKERAGGRIGIFYKVFDNDKRVTLFSLLIKGPGQAELGSQAVRRERERLPKFLFGFIRFALAEQHLGQMLAQCSVVGR